MNWLISIQIFSLAIVSSVLSFSWETCGPSTDPVKLQELSITGNKDLFYMSFKMNVAENLTEPIEASLRIKRKVPFFNIYVEVPCVNNVGSCDYKDICALSPWKNEACPAVFIKNNIPCKCPIVQNHYEAKDIPVDLQPFALEIKGKYKLKLVLNKGGAELFCFKMKIQV